MITPANLMIFIKALFIISLGILEASSKFSRNLERLKLYIANKNNCYNIIEAFNNDNRSFIPSGQDSLKEYILAKEDAAVLLHRAKIVNTECILPHITKFVGYLTMDVMLYAEKFSQEKLVDVANFLSYSSTVDDRDSVLEAIKKLVDRMTRAQYDEYRYEPDEDKELTNNLVADAYVEKKIIELGILEKPDGAEIMALANRINDDNILLITKYLIDLVKLFHKLNFRAHPEWLIPLLGALKGIAIKHSKDSQFLNAVFDFIYSEQVVEKVLDLGAPHEYFAILQFMVILNAVKSGICPNAPHTDKLTSLYANELNTVDKFMANMSALNKISSTASYSDLREVLVAVKGLKQLFEDPLIKQILEIDYQFLTTISKKFHDIFTNDHHPLNALAWEIFSHIGLIILRLAGDNATIRQDAFINIIFALGHLIHSSAKDPNFYPTEQLRDIQPFMNEAFDGALNQLKLIRTHLSSLELQCLIKVFSLHPDEEKRSLFIDRAILIYLSDMSTKFNKYSSVREALITNKREVYLASFLTFVENQSINPSSSKSEYIKDYYSFIKRSGWLTKTEIKYFEDKFKGFKY